MSKTFSMPGWRMGFAVGNERLIAALTRVKSYLDYGAFTPIQVAATAALNGAGLRHRRSARRSTSSAATCWSTLRPRRLGRSRRRPPRCSPGRRSPRSSAHLGSLEFSKLLIEKADVAVAPGIGFGEHGDDYVRIALVENEQRIRQAARNIKQFLATADETHAQRRSARHAADRSDPAAIPAGTSDRHKCSGTASMAEPLRESALPASARSGASVRAHAPATMRASSGRASAAARSRSRPLSARPTSRIAASTFRGSPGSTIRSHSPRAPDIDVFVELIGGDGRRRPRHAVEAALEAGKHVVTANKALLAAPWRGARRDGRGEGRAAQLRGGGGRRHPGHQDDARVAGRQHGHPRLRHPQRHLQLHPDPHGAGGAVLRRRASPTPSGSAMPRPTRPSTSRATTPRTSWRSSPPRLRHGDRRRRRSTWRASPTSPRPISTPPPNSATASSCSAWRSAPTAASSSASIRRWCRNPSVIAQVHGVTNAVAIEADIRRRTGAVGAGRRRQRHGLGGDRRHRRHRQRGPASSMDRSSGVRRRDLAALPAGDDARA